VVAVVVVVAGQTCERTQTKLTSSVAVYIVRSGPHVYRPKATTREDTRTDLRQKERKAKDRKEAGT
jgi:hypothetical protein